jgi:hypothetical protein
MLLLSGALSSRVSKVKWDDGILTDLTITDIDQQKGLFFKY